MVPSSSVLFVSQAGITTGAVASYNVRKRVEAVKNCRRLNKHDMKYNGATPGMTVDPETFVSLLLRVVGLGVPVSFDVSLTFGDRGSRLMEWSVKARRRRCCRWRRRFSFIDVSWVVA